MGDKLLNSVSSKPVVRFREIEALLGRSVKSEEWMPYDIASNRSGQYTRRGNVVDVDQGCIFVGTPDLVLESYGFEACSPFVMIPHNKDGKRVLGHIGGTTTPEEIVNKIKTHFSPKEIESAEYHYFRGEESYSPEEKLGRFAVETIESALGMLGVKGRYHGRISGFDTVIVNSNGLNIKKGTM